MTELLSVWSAGAVAASTIGGLLLGWLLVARFDNPRFTALESIGVVLVIGTFAGLVFWSGQIVDTLAQDGPALAWRVVSRFLLFLLFVVALGLGTGVGVRRDRGIWR